MMMVPNGNTCISIGSGTGNHRRLSAAAPTTRRRVSIGIGEFQQMLTIAPSGSDLFSTDYFNNKSSTVNSSISSSEESNPLQTVVSNGIAVGKWAVNSLLKAAASSGPSSFSSSSSSSSSSTRSLSPLKSSSENLPPSSNISNRSAPSHRRSLANDAADLLMSHKNVPTASTYSCLASSSSQSSVYFPVDDRQIDSEDSFDTMFPVGQLLESRQSKRRLSMRSSAESRLMPESRVSSAGTAAANNFSHLPSAMAAAAAVSKANNSLLADMSAVNGRQATTFPSQSFRRNAPGRRTMMVTSDGRVASSVFGAIYAGAGRQSTKTGPPAWLPTSSSSSSTSASSSQSVPTIAEVAPVTMMTSSSLLSKKAVSIARKSLQPTIV